MSSPISIALREALPVEVVDDVVLADEVAGELDVAGDEARLRLGDQRLGLLAHRDDVA